MFSRFRTRTSSLDRISAGTRWSLETIRKMIAKTSMIKDDVKSTSLNIVGNEASIWIFGKENAFFSLVEVKCKLNWSAGAGFIVSLTVRSVSPIGKIVSTSPQIIFGGQSTNQDTTNLIVNKIIELSDQVGIMTAMEDRESGYIAERLLGF